VTDPAPPSFDPAAIDTTGAITLVVARRSGRNHIGNRLAMNTDVVEELRTICQGTLAAIGERTPVAYADDLDRDVGSQYVLVPSAALVAHRPEPRRGRRPADEPVERPQIEVDPGARVILARASSLDPLNARDLSRQSFTFYAAVVGDDPDHRVTFVDQWNPYKAGLSGRLLTNFGDRLRRIEGPLLVFERSFDMVVTDTAIAVLDLAAFEAVFRDIDAMVDRRPVWSAAAVAALPFDDDTASRLAELCAKGGRLATQLRGMYERGVFGAEFGAADLRAEMKRQNLDAGRLLVRGKLVLEEADIPVVLKLIDEKLYRGWHSDTPWDVGTRSKRPT
jgi:hypothetical protein